MRISDWSSDVCSSDLSESDGLAQRIRTAMSERGFGWWAAEVPGVAPFIGFIGLSVPDFGAHFLPPGQRVVEIGWRLARAFWGRGYATEGAREALRFGFAELGLAEVVRSEEHTSELQSLMRNSY